MIKLIKNTKVQLLIITFITVITYSNIFQNTFVGDDELFVKTWDLVKHIENIPQFFLGHEFNDAHTRYRPVGSAFLALYYHLWGENPVFYHVVTLSLHLINTILIYFISGHILQKISARFRKSSSHKFSSQVPFIASLIFGVHPVNIEVVAIMFSSINIGYTFAIASFFFYIKAKRFMSKTYFLSLIFAILAFFSYEPTLILLALIVFYDLVFTLGKITFKSLRQLPWKMYVIYIIGSISYLFIRIFLLGITTQGHYLDDNFILTRLVMLKVFLMYVILLIFPLNLTINHTIFPGVQVWIDPFTNMNSLRLLSLFTPEIFLGLCLFIFLLFWAFKSYKRDRLTTFAIGWFFISLLPVSYILPQDTILQERYAYLASFGYCLLFVHLVNKFLISNGTVKKFVIIFIAIILGFYSARTYIRNKDWKDPITMWSTLVQELPNHLPTINQLASMYVVSGKDDLAIKYYTRIITLQPNVVNAYYELGLLYQKKGKIKEAASNYNRALSLFPSFLPAKAALEKLVKESTSSAKISSSDDWISNPIDDNFWLFYPKSWKITKLYKEIRLTDSKEQFHVQFSPDTKESKVSTDDYIKLQKETLGKLKRQGLAKIPNTDFAYVKVFDDGRVAKMQFFLFKDTRVVKIVVFPVNSPFMKVFDEILGAMRI